MAEATTTFSDSLGRRFECVCDVSTAMEMQKSLKINVNDLLMPGPVQERLQTDWEFLVDVLSIVCAESIKAHNLDAIGFAKGLGGDTLETASEAMIEAVINFSPPLKRAALKKLKQKGQDVMTLQAEMLNAEIDSLSPQDILTSWRSAGSKPESLASIPDA